jgi:hypothetical protein
MLKIITTYEELAAIIQDYKYYNGFIAVDDTDDVICQIATVADEGIIFVKDGNVGLFSNKNYIRRFKKAAEVSSIFDTVEHGSTKSMINLLKAGDIDESNN